MNKLNFNLGLAMLLSLCSIPTVHAKSKDIPYYPAVTLKVIAGDLGTDGCVIRINPPSMTDFKYQYFGNSLEQPLAGYLQNYAYIGSGGEFISYNATKEMTIPFVIQNLNGQKSLKTISVQAVVSPVKVANTDASALSLGNLLPVIDDVNDYLLDLPNTVIGLVNGTLNRWNQAVNSAKQNRQAQASLKVSEVTEWKIQSAMEVTADAQALLLVKYACDGQDVAKYSAAINTYLNRMTNALTGLNTP